MPKADDYQPLEQSDRDELKRLRRDMEASSLGDKPYSMSAMKLQRLIELEAAEIRDYTHMSLQPERRYTLAEIEQLAIQWRDENEATTDAQWIVSHLIAWLKKREREVGNG